MGVIAAERPKTVDAAVAILAIVLVVGVLRMFSTTSLHSVGLSPPFFIAATLVSTALVGFLIAMIADGRNWARVVYTVIVAYSVVRAIAIAAAVSQVPADVAVALATRIANLLAIVLLFTPAANAWFRQARVLRD